MTHDTRWDVWTPDEELVYSEFAESHADGAPWPIQQMDLATATRKLNCRSFTQHVLELKALLEWKKEQAAKEKRKEVPEIFITAPSDNFDHSGPSPPQEGSSSSADLSTGGLTASEWSIYNEFANIQRPGGVWAVYQMDDMARARGLVCRAFTQEMLDHEFKNHPNYRPPKPADALGKKPKRKVLTLAEARQRSAVQEKVAVEGGGEPNGRR
jgi:hypothetical protein